MRNACWLNQPREANAFENEENRSRYGYHHLVVMYGIDEAYNLHGDLYLENNILS